MAELDLASLNPYAQLLRNTTKQQIRLLKVIQNHSQRVECTLEVFDLDATPAYTALSYRWGSPSAKHGILINGHPSYVSDNLFYSWSRIVMKSAMITYGSTRYALPNRT